MKKFLSLFFFELFFLTSIIYPTTGTIVIENKVPEEELSYLIRYKDQSSSYMVNTKNPLSIAGGTLRSPTEIESGLFSIYISGNTLLDKKSTITISTTNFIREANNYDSKIAVIAKISPSNKCFSTKQINIPTGFYQKENIFSFYLSWIGKENVPSGKYTSTITIDYKVE